jgi:hypothetical protein
MNNKGFVGFVLILAMATLLLFFTIQLNQNNENLEKTKNELIKAEIANKERTLLENNVDKIIDTKLNEQITLQNFNTQTAKNSINSALFNYLNKKAKVYLLNGTTNEISLLFLNQNSSVQLLKSEYFIYAEYVYSPNTLTTQLKQKLGNKLISEYIFPANYTKTIMRVV